MKVLDFSVPMKIDDDPFGKAPLNKGLNKKRLASPKPGSPALHNMQKTTVKKDPNAIHEDLLCLSMDTSPPKQKIETETEMKKETGDAKQGNLLPEPSKGSPQLSTRSSKQKQTAADLEALDTNPILEPQRRAAETQRPATSDTVQTSKSKAKPEEPFDFLSDLLKTSTLPNDSSAKSSKMKMSKSADMGISNGQTKVSMKTRSGSKDAIQGTKKKQTSKKIVSDDIDMEWNYNQEDQEDAYTSSSSPAF